MKVHLDFETRSEVDIWESGAWVYAAHPTTDILCIGYAIDDGPVHIITKTDLEKGIKYLPSAFVHSVLENKDALFIAHNAFFEQCIWKHILVPRYKFPKTPIQKWRCTLAKACAYGIPKSLDKSAEVMGLVEQKDKAGRAVMLKMSKPLSSDIPVKYDNSPEHFKLLYEYCKQDVRTERELDNILPDLSRYEQEIWFYDQLINMRGISVDVPAVKEIIKIIEHKTEMLNRELTTFTNGRITKGTQVQAMLAYLNETGAKLTSLDKKAVDDAIKSKVLSAHHLHVLRLRQQLGKSSLAKYTKLISAVDKDSILRDCYVYHAATPGRWGGKLVQLQNLPRGKINTDEMIADVMRHGYPAIELLYPGKIMDNLSACIRGVFVPAAGHEMLVVDYSAIEARVLMWLANETKGLKEFQISDRGEDEDIYVKMAQRIYEDKTLTKKKNPDKRMLGKQTILGAGYGMGHVKFQATCAGYGIILSEEEASRIINLYRSTYFNIKNYWYDTERAVLEAFNTPDKTIVQGRISWEYDTKRNIIRCSLPSGRILTYHRPKIAENKFGGKSLSFMTEVTSQWVRRDVYGGMLVENVTQAVARDIMAYSISGLEYAGFPVLMHTHDEIVSQQPIGENRLQEMKNIMCAISIWAHGCPIEAEGFVCTRYKKG